MIRGLLVMKASSLTTGVALCSPATAVLRHTTSWLMLSSHTNPRPSCHVISVASSSANPRARTSARDAGVRDNGRPRWRRAAPGCGVVAKTVRAQQEHADVYEPGLLRAHHLAEPGEES